MRAKLLCVLLLLPLIVCAADVIVIPGDPPGQGFNNPAPAAPVGGNPGTTIGQQALNVFQRAANIWGSRLQSTRPILVIAFFTPLPCGPTSGVLGAAGPNWYFRDVTPANGGKTLAPGTWYPAALAEKITRQELTTAADPADPFEIFTLFNSNLGQPGCLTGNGWYYGLDNQEPANRIDLLAVVLHEFGHGLGFLAGPTNAQNGARALGFPSVWESHMLDLTTGKRWIAMTNAERAASARNDGNLVWAGRFANAVVPSVLGFRIEIEGLSPASLGVNEALAGSFGAPVRGRIRGTLVAPNDGGGVSLQDGCEPFPAGANVAGNFVLVNRGNCTFTQKALNAQNAGAIGVVIANSAAGPLAPSGADPNIFISAVGVTQAFGAALRAAAPAVISLQTNSHFRSGTTQGFPRLFAPAVFQGGSSVSHWDTTATPNLLMEPSINSNLTSSVKNPEDLTRGVFFDIGW